MTCLNGAVEKGLGVSPKGREGSEFCFFFLPDVVNGHRLMNRRVLL
jgi:hypothetical protein